MKVDQSLTAISSSEIDLAKNEIPNATPVLASRLVVNLDLIIDERKTVYRFLIFGILISLLLTFLLPKQYEAIGRLMPPDQSNGTSALVGALAVKGGDALANLAGEALNPHTGAATVVGILNSRTIADDLIKTFDLRKVYREKDYEGARRMLARRSNISEDKKSGIITISVQDRDPQRAAHLARAYIESLNGRVAQLTTSSAHRERVFLEERLSAIKKNLDESTLRLNEFSSNNKTYDPQIQGRAMLEATAALQGQLIAAETELKGVEQMYGPANSRVRAASAKVAEFRKKLQQVSTISANNGETDRFSNPGSPYPPLQELPLLENTYVDLARQAKNDEIVYQVLTEQYELAKVQEAKEIPSVTVLDDPVVPDRKIWPPRAAFVILGSLLWLCLGVSWVLLADHLRRLDPRDPRRVFLRKVRLDIGTPLKTSGVTAK